MPTLLVVKNPNLITASTVGLAYEPTLEAPGGLTSADDADGPYLRHATSAAAGSSAGVLSSFDAVEWQGLSEVSFELKTYPADVAPSVRWEAWIGLFSRLPTDLADPPAGASYAAFRIHGTSGAIETVTSTNGQVDSVTSKPPPGQQLLVSPGGRAVFRIERTAPGDVVFYRPDGVTPYTTHAPGDSLPAADARLAYGVRVFASTAAARSIRWKTISITLV